MHKDINTVAVGHPAGEDISHGCFQSASQCTWQTSHLAQIRHIQAGGLTINTGRFTDVSRRIGYGTYHIDTVPMTSTQYLWHRYSTYHIDKVPITSMQYLSHRQGTYHIDLRYLSHRLTVPITLTDGTYHIDGELTVADKPAIKNLVAQLTPLLKALENSRKIFLMPLARCWVRPRSTTVTTRTTALLGAYQS